MKVKFFLFNLICYFIDIFRVYKASPLKLKENQEHIPMHQKTKNSNEDHNFSGEAPNDDDNFSFSNNNESYSKDFQDSSNKKIQGTHKKNNSLHETPFYNARVNNKQEFLHPESQEKGFGNLEDREVQIII